jgi:hypothetical protein
VKSLDAFDWPHIETELDTQEACEQRALARL